MIYEDMLLIADRCWGDLGTNTVRLWRQYNEEYFGSILMPTPVLYVPTTPYGGCVGLTCRDRYIYLMPPNGSRSWAFTRGTLLHEMTHQYLQQVEKNPKHAGEPWCSEIMRLSTILGKNIWAGKYTVKKVEGKSVRANTARPADSSGQILNQVEIGTWPQTLGIDPPDNL
jgi:hypothetical protein